VDDRPGITRDRNFSLAEWAGRSFFIVDTGGVIEGSDEPMDRLIRGQALMAVEEADLILFLVDGKAGVHPQDERIAELLRNTHKPILVAVNKVDNLPLDTAHHEFWGLGLGEPVPVSAMSGKGSGDLLDRIVAQLPDPGLPDPDSDLRIAVIGRPNVGKSSFVNALFGEDRMIVSEVPGTNRDAVDSTFLYHGKRIVFVDTAGLRRQARVSESVEYYSALRTERVIRDAHVCLILLDGTQEVSHQDLRIAESAWEAGCGVVLMVNKWDLVEKDHMTAPAFEKALALRAPFLAGVPILFASALTGQRIRKSLDLILEVAEERKRRIPTHEVNEVLERVVYRQPPPHSAGRLVKLRYGTQIETEPPTFILFSNIPDEIPPHYFRYLQNEFRAAWGLHGVPIRIRLRESPGTRKGKGG
jgi:GTP-binding protein